MPTLHVVVPFYEESGTLDACLRRVITAALPAGWSADVTLVNDGSSSSASDAARRICADIGIRFLEHPRNRGKGAAIRTGFASVLERATDDDVIIIQDADLEYDPADYMTLMQAIVRDGAVAVFGNRWGRSADPRLQRRVHRWMNRALTITSNTLSGLHVHDMECCYKLFRTPVLRAIMPALTEDRFGIEPQIAAALGRLGVQVAEASVRYDPRSFAEGKKIRAKDGIRALWVIARERFRRVESTGVRTLSTAERPL
ncbi:MAG: glycosyltransferase family 2 protein [Phycisphaerae bacterium]|nr:glycosyltransferase family 2 protein [Phycisphaerae bacterium]